MFALRYMGKNKDKKYLGEKELYHVIIILRNVPNIPVRCTIYMKNKLNREERKFL